MSDPGSAAPPLPLKAPPAHGILKKRSNDDAKQQKVFRWDEEAVAETEAGKDSTMKIDEPPTPYNRSFDSADVSQSTSDTESAGEETTRRRHERTSSVNSVDAESLPLAVSDPNAFSSALTAGLDAAAGGDHYEPKDLEEVKDKQFVDKRKKHYNEFEAVKRWRREHADGEAEAEKDSKDQ